ncbi:MAG: histidine--tRNA ligase [Ignavibacteria bacterium]|nr:histidine--tRNA ligase [Ignavibacteria bacterium]
MFKSIRGTKDIFLPEIFRWQKLESIVHQVMKNYNFTEIRTPIFEETALFARGIGDETDIVGKEMYTFKDKSDTSLTLKPEMTAAVVRAFIQHNLGELRPINKFYYISPMFRQERPQSGRLRQFHQVGAEIFGVKSFSADGELIILAIDLLEQLNVKNLELLLNSVGCQTCRPKFIKKLVEYFEPIKEKLSPESQNRLQKNPLRILDSKDERDIPLKKGAPSIIDNLCNDCKSHYEGLKDFLIKNNVAFLENPYLVRGLDYYTKTAFEFTSSDLGAQNAICGGGRYDLLVEQLGGKPTPGVGWACGIERILLASEKYEDTIEQKVDIYFVVLKPEFKLKAFQIVRELRKKNFSCEIDLLDRSLKAQMREANKLNAKVALILGDEEYEKNSVKVKELSTGQQEEVFLDNLFDYLKQKIR